MQRVVNAVKEAVENGVNGSIKTGSQIDSRRLFHGRGQCYSNLGFINVDWYHPVIIITLYQEVCQLDWQQLLTGLDGLVETIDCLLVQRRYLRGAPIECVWGQLPEQAVAHEQGLQFSLAFTSKQNIGFFLDMSTGRQWLRDRAANKRILNLFAYTCSLSVAAIAGGARQVVNVDMSRGALTVGRKNHQLNQHAQKLKRDIQFMPYDIFRSWRAITKKGPYDIIIVDPPSRQKGSFIADKDYVRVVRRLEALMPEGGEVLLCLNAPELGESFLHDLMSAHIPQSQRIERLHNRADLPEVDPERNVKMIHYHLPAPAR
jgi:23S rRNA (cytosine1962-C5)-methyltransferase